MNINTIDNKEKGRKPFEGTHAYEAGIKDGKENLKALICSTKLKRLNAKCPNLEILSYIAFQLVYLMFNKIKCEFDIYVFPQVWPSTCLGIDCDENGEGFIGGQAMTKAFTSVFYDTLNEIYVVFFDDNIAYIVSNPTDEFYEDLKNNNLKSRSKAKIYY